MINLVSCNSDYLYITHFLVRFPCRWQGNDIIILDQFIVKSPYGPDNLTPLQASTQIGLNRIKLVVSIVHIPLFVLYSSIFYSFKVNAKNLDYDSPTCIVYIIQNIVWSNTCNNVFCFFSFLSLLFCSLLHGTM